MKIIKALLLLTTGLVVNQTVSAQQLQNEKLVAKPVVAIENSTPAPGSKPALAATDVAPLASMPVKAMPAEKRAVAAAPNDIDKSKLVIADAKTDNTAGLTNEQKSTLNGTFKAPKITENAGISTTSKTATPKAATSPALQSAPVKASDL
ncbi:MAG: hypothetical protein IPP48_04510 [Chitinophagaceae bacterium]|nr:hypothetical protein [Chitinophagaceae bacterium]